MTEPYITRKINPQLAICTALEMINYIMFDLHTKEDVEAIHAFIYSLRGHLKDDLLNELEELIKNIQK
jgi:hypothetical protein